MIYLLRFEGQLEVEPQKMSPNLHGATLITESVIVKLNQEIEVSFDISSVIWEMITNETF